MDLTGLSEEFKTGVSPFFRTAKRLWKYGPMPPFSNDGMICIKEIS
jgi:hypothetical protein